MIYLVIRGMGRTVPGSCAPCLIERGELLFGFEGETYGAIGPDGIALSEHGELEGPFFEYPKAAVRPL